MLDATKKYLVEAKVSREVLEEWARRNSLKLSHGAICRSYREMFYLLDFQDDNQLDIVLRGQGRGAPELKNAGKTIGLVQYVPAGAVFNTLITPILTF